MLKIITYADKRPDFIEFQYNSIKKHLKDVNYEFIVFDNAIDNAERSSNIQEICKNLNIKCVKVEVVGDLKVIDGNNYFTNKSYVNAREACAYPLIWTFKKYFKDNTPEFLSIIDSDMFFIKDINISDLLKDNDLFYIPQYRAKGSCKYIWNAFVCINFKKNPNFINLNWHSGAVNGDACDVGGQTHYDLLNKKFNEKIMEEYSIYQYDVINNNKKIHYIQNGNVNYEFFLGSDNELLSVNHIGGHKLENNKSFPHEKDFENSLDYNGYIYNRLISIINILNKNEVNLPYPQHIGFIGFMDEEDFFILHYKSGSNYLSFSNQNYNYLKTNEIKKILNYEQK